MTKLDVLIKARKILSDPRRWTKGAFISSTSGDGEACYCALGAIAAAASGGRTAQPSGLDAEEDKLFESAARTVARAIVDDSWVTTGEVWRFNDSSTTTYEDVMQKFSDAIQAEVAAQSASTEQVAA